jgi:hypothetical protein
MKGELRILNSIDASVNRKKLSIWSAYSTGNPNFWLTNQFPMLSNNNIDINAPMVNRANCDENNDFLCFRLSSCPRENERYL